MAALKADPPLPCLSTEIAGEGDAVEQGLHFGAEAELGERQAQVELGEGNDLLSTGILRRPGGGAGIGTCQTTSTELHAAEVAHADCSQVVQAAALQNAGGSYAKPTTKEASEALGSIDLGPNLTGSNPNPKAGYPIVTFTWILLYKSGNGDKLKSLQQAFNYTLSDAAQANAPSLGYVSLPANVLQKARAAVASIGE